MIILPTFKFRPGKGVFWGEGGLFFERTYPGKGCVMAE